MCLAAYLSSRGAGPGIVAGPGTVRAEDSMFRVMDKRFRSGYRHGGLHGTRSRGKIDVEVKHGRQEVTLTALVNGNGF